MSTYLISCKGVNPYLWALVLTGQQDFLVNFQSIGLVCLSVWHLGVSCVAHAHATSRLSSQKSVKTPQKKCILISLTIAKKIILLHWKDRTKISIIQWLESLTHHSNMEQLTFTIKDKRVRSKSNHKSVLKSSCNYFLIWIQPIYET